LAGRVIASHYAEPVRRRLAASAPFRRGAGDDCDLIAQLSAGSDFWLLDDSGGWAWGYGGTDRRVGYVRAEALGD